ncbi:MAG: UDP-3-O-acyl-N-acetylglucosamine deacetylase [Leptospirales bacterium]|nr:UDP-3-O-acyl-N-acetylglucosamine deacetylase [Leptospirales bacterium]
MFDSERIRELIAQRHPSIRKIPATLQKTVPFKHGRAYGIDSTVTIQGISSFENKPVEIKLSPTESTPVFEFRQTGERFAIDPGLCQKGQHNIQLGSIKIVEHPLSFMSAFGVRCDVSLDQPSFPTFDYCNLPYLEAVQGHLVDLGPESSFSITKPACLLFGKGYCILEPDQGADALLIDHQVSYPGTSVGTTRLELKLTPETYAFLCAARTPSFRTRSENLKNYELVRSGQVKEYPVTTENVLFVDEEEFYNPRAEFVSNRFNYEFMMHEIIDIIAWLRFLEIAHNGRFVGKMTTFLFDHHAQIDAAIWACADRSLWTKSQLV